MKDFDLMSLLALLGAALILKGLLFVAGRTIPKGVWQHFDDRQSVRRWGIDTGIIQLIWGSSFVLLWVASTWPVALYIMPVFWVFLVAGLIFSVYVMRKYKNENPTERRNKYDSPLRK